MDVLDLAQMGTSSFKDALKGKEEVNTKPAPPLELPGPYIVEKKSQIPTLTVSLPKVNELYVDFYIKVVICRFNGF